MKKKFLIIPVSLLLVGISFFIFSCTTEIDEDTTIAQDNAMAEGVYEDASNIADQAAVGSLTTFIPDFGESILSGCATVTRDTTANPKTITIDFGSSNCLCMDSRYRRGQIIVSYTGGYRDTGTVITTTFNNYFVNDYEVQGTRTVTNKGLNTNNNLNFDVVVTGTVIKPNSQGTVTWNSTRNREWIAGSATQSWWDDVYLITGSASGTSAVGTPFTVLITKALRKEIGYRYMVSGTVEISPDYKAKRILDFGNGVRDDKATVEINGKVYDIHLR